MAIPEAPEGYTVTFVALQNPMPLRKLHAGSVDQSIKLWKKHGPQARTVSIAFGEQILFPDVTGLRRPVRVSLQDANSEGNITVEGGTSTPLVPTEEGIEIIGKRWGRWGAPVILGLIIPQTEAMEPAQPDPTRGNIWPRATTSLQKVIAGLNLSSL